MGNDKNDNVNRKIVKSVKDDTIKSVLYGLLISFIIIIIEMYSRIGSIDFSSIFYAYQQDSLFFWIYIFPFVLGTVMMFYSYKKNKEKFILNEKIAEQQAIIARNVEFAERIGKGEFDVDIEIIDDDKLGKALITMLDNLIENEKREEERNSIISMTSDVGTLLRMHNDLKILSEEVVAYITKKINAVQGAFYVVNDDDSNDVYIELISSYAYNKKKYLKGKYKFAQGLIGQAAIEKDKILRTEIPYDYVTITSGLLGDRRPSCLLIVPLITNETVYGVIEFAGFELFSQMHIKFVEELSDIIARTIFNVKVNERTLKLLKESQEMSKELREQREQLLLNAEEMEATQEELKYSNDLLEKQIQEVKNSQKRLQVLLENSSEIITIYKENRNIKYISPSVLTILGFIQESLIDKSLLENIHEEDVEKVDKMFDNLINRPQEKLTIQYRFKRKGGDYIWLEATGKNLIKDPVINGIIFNSQDITIRIMAEKEQRMRGQMQALSENSPDLITRIGISGKIFYINPVIEKLTGLNKEEFINKSYKDVSLSKDMILIWGSILADTINLNTKVEREIIFKVLEEEIIMQINSIPEYGQDGNIESILIVAHDITQRKIFELEIQKKNKDITESINYAQRIQSSLLPTPKILKEHIDSFMFFKPKDVVSGDFPWIYKRENILYVAAVDCTGHGVPGALMSFIGHFSLNQIMSENENWDSLKEKDISISPANILDKLHTMVQKTLKQGNGDSEARDGMDISLCKINILTKEVQYAGAHRPLFVLQKGELIEIKGDRYPIGGMHYKNRADFTNHSINLEKGDSFYFYTDGLPDQFGGSNGDKKFMTKKIKEIILSNKNTNMKEMKNIFIRDFEAWKGDYKQMDDVLLIGIKL
ncbi:MAG: hypothetical protein A2X12_02760 [Bacteroidetes bacterium GWE2_29_8]|nr:MAG: hypothetical protein A2X12_02760 [Bacteroidetes bacterium GWE2_29_8]OFY20095.1 MAG: hypothetical protein A2X02_06955 [Bacteroidetes bacterium GWF2_29_10]